MMKTYQKPYAVVVPVQMQESLLAITSVVDNLGGDGLVIGGGGSGWGR